MKRNPKNLAVSAGSIHFVNAPWRAYFAALRILRQSMESDLAQIEWLDESLEWLKSLFGTKS